MSRRSSFAEAAPRRTSSRKPIIFLCGAALGALVWFAPNIIANSPLRAKIIAAAAADFEGTIEVGSISAGWLSSPTAHDIVVYDAQGERLIEAETVGLEKNLLSLLANHTDLGTIRIQHPWLNLVLRPDGSNLEDALAPLFAPSDKPAPAIGCAVEVEEGTIELTDAVTGNRWTASNFSLAVGKPVEPTMPLTMQVKFDLPTESGAVGTLAGEFVWTSPLDVTANSIGNGNLSLNTHTIPADVVMPFLRRFMPGISLSGLVTSDMKVSCSEAGQTLQVTSLNIQRFALAAPRWLGADQIRLESVRAAGEITQRGRTWQVQPTVLETDLGRLQLAGSLLSPDGQALTNTQALLQMLRQGQFSADGQLDLARLAAMLPNTLRIRQGTYVSSGQVTLGARSELTAAGQRWDGRLEASGLSAMHEGRRISWEKPVVLTLAARDQNGVVAFDELSCDSSFLQVSASGTSTQGQATLQGNLGRLATELAQFVELGELSMDGQLRGQATWQIGVDGGLKVEGSGAAEKFQLVSGSNLPWREDLLNVSLAAVTAPRHTGLNALQEALLRVESGSDMLNVELLPAAAGAVRQDDLPLNVTLTGELANWLARLQPFVSLEGWNARGVTTATAQARISPERIAVSQAAVEVKDLQLAGSLFINEPVVKLEGSGSWDRLQNAFSSPGMTLASPSLALRTANVVAAPAGSSWQVVGDVSYRGDLARIAAWLRNPRQPASQSIAGQATGQMQLRVESGVTTGSLSGDVADFVYLTSGDSANGQPASWTKTWQEPRIKLATDVTYDPNARELRIARLELAGEAASLAAAGTVRDPFARGVAELDGKIAYDLQTLSSRLPQQMRSQIQLAGRETRSFSFRGPIFASRDAELYPVSIDPSKQTTSAATAAWLAELLAQASLGWTSASVHGLQVGPGSLDAQLAEGKLTIAPLDLQVSEGRVRLAPEIELNAKPQVLTLAPGPAIEQVRISPRMCSTWLKYVAPLVADAAAAEGRFSLDLQKAVIPLDKPTAGDVEGVLEVHQAQIGPGPLSQQLLMLAAQIKALTEGRIWDGRSLGDRWLELPSQRVSFRMAENRVYHQGLQMAVDQVVIRTSGSVGTDQTLSLVAEVPLRDEWLQSSRYLQALRGQTLQVPVHGTLSQPRIDQSALQQITQQTVTGAANRVLQDELNRQLNRGLDKLFGPPRQ